MEVYTIPTGTLRANCYIAAAQDGSAAVIDPGADVPMLLDFLQTHSLTVRHILLTHGHADHIGGADALRSATGAPISIHELDRRCTDTGYSLAEQCGYPFCPFLPDTLLHDGDCISLGDETLTVLHTPGHSPGGVCYIHEKDRILFSGDTLFCYTAGRTDFPGGSFDTLMESLQKLRDLEGDYTVYPGHERATTLEHERKRNYFMRRLGK